MEFALNEEQVALQQAVRDLLRARAGEGTLHDLLAHGRTFDRTTWKVMAEQLGLQGLPVPEQLGGAGCGAVELAVVLEEMGRVLYSGPYLSTLLGTTALRATGDDEGMSSLLPGVVKGDVVLALALVGIALFVTGAMVGLLSGGPPLRRALRQLLIGYGAAAVTYALGLLFGVSAG